MHKWFGEMGFGRRWYEATSDKCTIVPVYQCISCVGRANTSIEMMSDERRR